jgi:hypothetical protein
MEILVNETSTVVRSCSQIKLSLVTTLTVSVFTLIGDSWTDTCTEWQHRKRANMPRSVFDLHTWYNTKCKTAIDDTTTECVPSHVMAIGWMDKPTLLLPRWAANITMIEILYLLIGGTVRTSTLLHEISKRCPSD